MVSIVGLVALNGKNYAPKLCRSYCVRYIHKKLYIYIYIDAGSWRNAGTAQSCLPPAEERTTTDSLRAEA